MKKTTLIFLTTFFFFVGITTTKAYGEEVSPILDLDYLNYNFIIEEKPTELAMLSAENYVLNNCKDYEHYVITKGLFLSSRKNNSNIQVYCWNDSDLNNLIFKFYKYSSSKTYANLVFAGDSRNSVTLNKVDFDSNGNVIENETCVVNFIEFAFSSPLTSTVYTNSTSNKDYIIPFIKTNLKVVLSDAKTNISWNYVYKSLKYNNIIYNLGDEVFDFENGTAKSPDNIFHETIYTTNYNSIEFEFDLASLPLYSEGNTFNLDFEFKSVTQSGEDETIKFSLPYYTLTQLVDSTTEEGASITLTKEDVKEYFKQDNYIYTYSNSEKIRYLNDLGILEKNYTKYKITLPLEFSYASFVDVYFKSNLDFEVIRNYSSSYDESIVSDIETIDLTNKYGVVFIPLVKNGSIHFPFKSVGHFFVQHRDSYNEDFNILSTTTVGYCDEYHKNDENYICADLSGLYSFIFKEGFNNQVLTFINRNYENDTNSFVEYHSNSFNYCVLDTPTSTCNIINPNTDEEVNLTLKDYFDYKTESNNESFFEMFSNAFNRFKIAILSIFDYISIYFESLPSILKDFYIVIFVFVILAVIVKFLI